MSAATGDSFSTAGERADRTKSRRGCWMLKQKQLCRMPSPSRNTLPSNRRRITRPFITRALLPMDPAFYHLMGTDTAKDPIIYGNSLGREKILSMQLSEDGAYLVYLIIYGSGSERTEIYVQNVKENGPVVAAVNDQKSLFYPTFAGDRLFILTNWKAPQWRVFSTSLASPQREHWREVLPAGDVHLESIAASGGKLIGQYTHNAASELKVFDGDGKVQTSIS